MSREGALRYVNYARVDRQLTDMIQSLEPIRKEYRMETQTLLYSLTEAEPLTATDIQKKKAVRRRGNLTLFCLSPDEIVSGPVGSAAHISLYSNIDDHPVRLVVVSKEKGTLDRLLEMKLLVELSSTLSVLGSFVRSYMITGVDTDLVCVLDTLLKRYKALCNLSQVEMPIDKKAMQQFLRDLGLTKRVTVTL